MTAPRKLQQDAVRALQKGKWKRALECYLALERAQPRQADWPRRAGEILRQVDRVPDAIKAFERAAAKYEAAGFEAKAHAVYRMILQLDPYHEAAFRRSIRAKSTGSNLAIGSRRDIPQQAAAKQPDASPAMARHVAKPVDAEQAVAKPRTRPPSAPGWPRADTKQERVASILADLDPLKK